MTSCTLTASLSQPAMMCDRMELDAARALLGVSPSGSSSPSSSARVATSSIYSAALQVEALDRETRQVEQQQQHHHHDDEPLHWRTTGRLSDRNGQDQQLLHQPTNGLYEQELRLEESPENEMHTAIAYKRPRSDSAGLDALAALATKETSLQSQSPLAPFLVSNSNLSSEDSDACSNDDGGGGDDDEGMPPPPPRRRRRSASNPEGMEKWDSLKRNHKLSTGRRHFVLPASILEEELQAVSAAMQERELAGWSNGTGATATNIPRSIPEDEDFMEKSSSHGDDGKEDEEEEVDEASLTPEELLRRARSRLLEDLSEGSVNGEKGVMTLPHSLSKYKEVCDTCQWREGQCGAACWIGMNCFMSLTLLTGLCFYRFTIKTAALAFTLPRSAPPLLPSSTANAHAVFGTRKSDTIAEKVWPIVVFASRVAL